MADIISGSSRFGKGNSNSNTTGKVVSINREESPIDELEQRYLDYQIKKHKRNVFFVVLIVVVIAVIFIFAARYILDGRTYNGYSIIKSINRDDTEAAKYTGFKKGYIRYSYDGISYYNEKGNSIWNQSFSMQNPKIKICENWMAVGDINGNIVYIFDENGMMGKIDTSYTISQMEVAKNGLIAVVLEDDLANYINLYNYDGTKLYTVKTTVSGDGYPIDVSISDDAEKLMVSYLYVSGDCMKTNVVFYNFSEVGQNEVERVVGGFNHYDSTIVGDVQFVNNTTAVAVGEDILSIYKIKEYPELKQEEKLDNTIERVFFSDEYIGVVLDNSDSGDIYKLRVYDLSLNKIFETTFNTQYSDMKFDGKSVVMNNQTTLALFNFKGKLLTDQKIELPIEGIITTGQRGKYVLVNSKYIQTIKLN